MISICTQLSSRQDHFCVRIQLFEKEKVREKKNHEKFNALQINVHNTQRDNDNQISNETRERTNTTLCV